MQGFEINERIIQLRKAKGLTQARFGEILGVSADVIKNIEYFRTTPKPLFIDLLCKVYDVNREWLETGNGEMFRQLSEEEELDNLIGEFLSENMSEQKKKLTRSVLKLISELPEEAFPKIREFAEEIIAIQPETKKDED